jgi:hypothetical protein
VAEHELAGLRCSDVLELSGSFVLGALPEDEAAAVRAHLAACPEAHAEVAELGSVVPALFETVELVQPPSALRDRILAAAAETQQAGAEPSIKAFSVAGDEAAAPAPGPATLDRPALPVDRTLKPYPAATDVQRRGFDFGSIFRRPAWAAVAMAAVIGVIALGAWNVQLRGEVDALAAYQRGVVAVLDAAGRPDAKLAVLTPPDGAGGPSGLASVDSDGAVAVIMRDLAPTTGTQVYETWLIGSDGTPVAIGGFTVGTGGTAAFTTQHPLPGGGVTVALTLEDAPGATTPKGPVVVVGEGQAQAS